jgi:hypothetical protein
MSTRVEKSASAHEEGVQLTEKEKWKLAIGLGAVSCGIILALGFAMYLFGAESTIDATVGTLALGAIVSFGAVVCFRTFGKPR